MSTADWPPVLDGLLSASREAELINGETESVWHDERGRRVRKMFLGELLGLQEELPGELAGVLGCLAESGRLLQEVSGIDHLYRQTEADCSSSLLESGEERARSFVRSDSSRHRCLSADSAARNAIFLIDQANATRLNF